MSENINRVTVTGNLTADPELRHTGGGTAVCSLRIAVNGRRKDQSGQWVDKPNFFNVTVWGAMGENCDRYLEKGRPVAIAAGATLSFFGLAQNRRQPGGCGHAPVGQISPQL